MSIKFQLSRNYLTNYIYDLGKTTPTYESNCRELIKIVDDFLSQSPDHNERLTENFVNGKFFS